MIKKTGDTCIRDCANINLINESIKVINKLSEQMERTAQILSLAGNETRLKILYIISQEEKVCVCDLGDILNVSVSAISQHLRKLKDGNLLKSNKEGQTIYYTVNPQSKKTIEKVFTMIHDESIQKVAYNEKGK
jgi:DNA-binding transcriptional ArsR family regulator